MAHDTPAVGILPHTEYFGYFPSSYPLDRLHWPLGQPKRLIGKTLRHMGRQDHLILYPRSTSYYRPWFGTRARVSVMILEPEVVHRRHMDKMRRFHRRFHRVLTANEALVADIPNGRFFPFGSTWVPDWRDVDVTKTRMVSLIASAKRSQPGHLPRHEIADWARTAPVEFDAIGRGYKPFDRKSEGLAPYRFSVVIENSREPNYFTEKLIDAILCEAVPIYLGCPNIDHFLPTDGMILCNDTDDIRNAVLHASEALFEEKLPALRAVKERAAELGETEKRAALAVLDKG